MSSILKLIILAVLVVALLYTCIRAFRAWYDREDSHQAGQKATRLMGMLFIQSAVSRVILTLVPWEPEANLHSGHNGVTAAVTSVVTLLLLNRRKKA